MARNPRRLGTRRAARLEFPALEIVGALLTPDMVARIASFTASDQSEESYGIPPGLKLRDEIARYFRIGEALWSRFSAARATGISASERFILELLQQCFGFSAIAAQKPARLGEREFPIRHAALVGRVPIVIAPAPPDDDRRAGIDESIALFADGSRKRSATLLLQEYLNAHDQVLWGLTSDGITLRLLRDNISLTRPAWIEADLSKIFGEGLFADFQALWLLVHQSRFGVAGATVSDCTLEHWRDRGRTDGVTARDKLRQGVEAALLELGQGFLAHPANTALRDALKTGTLSQHGYFEELLRLIYRLIFLFAAEDRDLLHRPNASATARKVYAEGYSLGRLRERSMHRAAWDRHIDGWEGLKVTFTGVARGETRLGLPALGGLFQPDQLIHFFASNIENRRFLGAIWRLAWLRPEGQPLTRVNWRDMETEELGSVYESLLELTPRASADTRIFDFAERNETRGNARKTTGSYYTPDTLVKLLLDTTLDPVLDAAEARSSTDPVQEILKLTIIDPACGSGHFLLGAARRAAARIAKLRSPGAPSQVEFQHALREVVSHCIYGVDRNPMAVELCKVALWIEAIEPGKPLSFLDARIRCGDSLIGVFDYATLKSGIPDEAFAPLSGDAKEVAKVYARQNKTQREGNAASGFLAALRPPTDVIDAAERLKDMPEDTLEQIAIKQIAFARLHDARTWQSLKTACDLYVAAFFLPKIGAVPEKADLAHPSIPLTDHVWSAVRDEAVYGPLIIRASQVAHRVRVFHWPLEFPDVFVRGGFDVVVGNPPWERIKLQEQEFFAAKSPEIANARNKAAREILIKALAKAQPNTPERALFDSFETEKRDAEAVSQFARNSGRYPLSGVGDVNTYALFAEHFSKSVRVEGRAGIIAPTGIATDSSTSQFFGDLVDNARIVRLIDFENRAGLFPAVDSRMKFSILAMGASEKADFAFFLTDPSQLDNKERRFSLTATQIARINPNTKTASVFRSRADAELTSKIYDRVPVLVLNGDSEKGDPWRFRYQTKMFDMADSSSLFRSRNDGEAGEPTRPLYEAKMIHHFDHRWATYDGGLSEEDDGARDVTLAEKLRPDFDPSPRYWVPEAEVDLRAARVPSTLKRAARDNEPEDCLRALALWLVGYFRAGDGRAMTEIDLASILGKHGWRQILGKTPAIWLMEERTAAAGAEAQSETPLTADDVAFLRDGPKNGSALAASIIARKQPRWLMGWRDICRSTDERTVIASVFPKVGVGHTIRLMYLGETPSLSAAMLANLSTIALDYVARQKVGGTHLTVEGLQQLPILAPTTYALDDLAFINQRILELTYTSHSMRSWAEDLGYSGMPFSWSEDRRAMLRAELDALFARKYGLTRDELRYVLDPADTAAPDYPSETFRVLKEKEIGRFGEYRTQRLVLESFDRLESVRPEQRGAMPSSLAVETKLASRDLDAVSDGAWARPTQPLPGDTGAVLAAILKSMDGTQPVRNIRLAAALILEPRLLVPLLAADRASQWRRLVGQEADPLQGNVAAFSTRVNAAWGTAVQNHRGNGRMVEDLEEGTWSSGTGLEAIETQGWPDGRAGFVLEALRGIDFGKTVESLPNDVQGWIVNAAAA